MDLKIYISIDGKDITNDVFSINALENAIAIYEMWQSSNSNKLSIQMINGANKEVALIDFVRNGNTVAVSTKPQCTLGKEVKKNFSTMENLASEISKGNKDAIAVIANIIKRK